MYKKTIDIGGRTLSISTGNLAKQADASVLVQYADTVVLVTLCTQPVREELKGADFVPLTIDYRERTYAAGRIPGGFFRREGKPRDTEILACRLIDRPIRPLLSSDTGKDILINAVVLSSDQQNYPDVPALIGASICLSLSSLPFAGPIGAVRIGYANGTFIVNPTLEELNTSELDLVVVGSENEIVMLEAGSKEVGENLIVEGIERAQQEIRKILELQQAFVKEYGIPKTVVALEENPAIAKADALYAQHASAVKHAIRVIDKLEREQALEAAYTLVKQAIPEDDEDGALSKRVFDKLVTRCFRELVVNDKARPDNRKLDEIRSLSCAVGVLPRTHGSGLFTRGQTQALVVTTLGTPHDAQIIDDLECEYKKKFMLHYNFPSFATGEVRPNRGPGRREIGHGVLAEKALEKVLPSHDTFPYTIRIVSDILESNGSSSMASVCGGTLSLMDAGVPISSPVAGISVGLVKEKEEVLLVDIAGFEDHYGDMDFKVAGTEKGITAIQLDIKIHGISMSVVTRTLQLAKEARAKILAAIKATIEGPRTEISAYAPRIEKMFVHPDKIRLVIGSGGKTIKKIVEEAKVEIDVQDNGEITISSVNLDGLRMAREMIESYTADVEIGKIYKGKVQRITNFGAFVEVLPGKDGLVHISQLADKRVNAVEDVVHEGDEIFVKVMEIDNLGRINLSKKVADRERQAGA